MGGEAGPRCRARLLAGRASARRTLRWLGLAAIALAACGDGSGGGGGAGPGDESSGAAVPTESRHTGDLDRIRQEGVLRILALRAPEAYLPRSGSPLDRERRRAAGLAEELGVESRLVFVDALDELIPALLDGRGDLIADNFTVTEARRQRVAFSAPVASTRDQVVVRADDPVRKPAELAGRRVAVQRSSSLWGAAEALSVAAPGLTLEEVPEQMETAEILDRVATGGYDLTLADSNLVRAALGWREDLRVAFDQGEARIIAWAVRPDAVALRKAVDSYLARTGRSPERGARHTDDLPGIEARGVLRVLTRNSPTTYFIWRGQLMGFEYELVREFAKRRDLQLEMVVVPTRADLVPWLLSGRGDLIAAGLTASDERAAREGVAFTRNTLGATPMVVARADDAGVTGPADLRGRRIAVRPSSSYWQLLEPRRAELGFELLAVPEHVETAQIIAGVAAGEHDLTVADSHILDVELTWRDDVRAAFALGEAEPHGWAVRPDAPELRAALDAYLKREYRGLFYNVLVRKYFKDRTKVMRHVDGSARDGRISRWDPLVQKYATRYGFDWRLIAAQMHQESRFEPSARSFAGARGLLQVLPRTGREFGFEALDDPETGIHAGVRYLAWIRERFEPGLSDHDVTWLSLAAYNAGYGHVSDARGIARSENELDPNRWFGHVERAMLLKSDPRYHRNTRFGYVRGNEPVRYVRAIRERYEAYQQAAGPLAAADPPAGSAAH